VSFMGKVPYGSPFSAVSCSRGGNGLEGSERDVARDVLLESRGDVSLESLGDASLESRGDVSLESRGDVSLESRGVYYWSHGGARRRAVRRRA